MFSFSDEQSRAARTDHGDIDFIGDPKEKKTFLTQEAPTKNNGLNTKVRVAVKLKNFKASIANMVAGPANQKKAVHIPKLNLLNLPLRVHVERISNELPSGDKSNQFLEDQTGSFSAGIRNEPKLTKHTKFIEIANLQLKPRGSVESTDGLPTKLIGTASEVKPSNKLVKLGSYSDQDEPMPKGQHSPSIVLAGLAANKATRTELV